MRWLWTFLVIAALDTMVFLLIGNKKRKRRYLHWRRWAALTILLTAAAAADWWWPLVAGSAVALACGQPPLLVGWNGVLCLCAVMIVTWLPSWLPVGDATQLLCAALRGG